MIEVRIVNFNKFNVVSVEEKLLHKIFEEIDNVNAKDVLYIYINFDRNARQNSRKAWIGYKDGEIEIELPNVHYYLLKKYA